jgi:hypothetical protein
MLNAEARLMRDDAGTTLRDDLLRLFRRPVDHALPDEIFGTLALRAFTWQFQRNEPYAAWCRRRGRTPAEVDDWRAIPAVPTAAFRHIELVSGDPAEAQAAFRTSGTTRGVQKRGVHHVLDLSLYHGSLVPNFAAYVLPDRAEMTLLSLLPPAEEMVDSSLAHMVAIVMDRLGGPGSRSLATMSHGIDFQQLEETLANCIGEGSPVCLLGTSFSFVHWMDRLRQRGGRMRLPAGSRLMDTGGYKGKGRDVPEDVLRETYQALLGLDPASCVNEYGMTELCSQFYDTTLRDRVLRGRESERRKAPPPWVRVRVVDPETLAPLPRGRTGLLQHFDLANLGSVCAIQTEDLGVEHDDGFVVRGRPAGAQPRGCSIAMDDLLGALPNTRR